MALTRITRTGFSIPEERLIRKPDTLGTVQEIIQAARQFDYQTKTQTAEVWRKV